MAAPTDPRSRKLGDERARYGRKSLREQLGDVIGWIAIHRVATAMVVGFLAVGLLLAGTQGLQVDPASLAVGDCLYVRTDAAQGDDRPIGDEHDVALTLLAGGAERASCAVSHGHEVSAIVTPAVLPTPSPGATPALLDATSIRAVTGPLCNAAFAGYVGHALDGSRYATFPVVPDAGGAAAWLNDGRRTICLVARADGQWMDHPARASGE
jgi:hypothetical protein